jgi:hypothetical protein
MSFSSTSRFKKSDEKITPGPGEYDPKLSALNEKGGRMAVSGRFAQGQVDDGSDAPSIGETESQRLRRALRKAHTELAEHKRKLCQLKESKGSQHKELLLQMQELEKKMQSMDERKRQMATEWESKKNGLDDEISSMRQVPIFVCFHVLMFTTLHISTLTRFPVANS